MNVRLGNGPGGFSAKWVIGRLRALSSGEPPESLKEKLMGGIPASAGEQPASRRIRPWSRGMWWTGVAAAVAVAASIVAWLGVPPECPSQSAFDANGRAGRAYAADHNSPGPSDSNLCDINGLR